MSVWLRFGNLENYFQPPVILGNDDDPNFFQPFAGVHGGYQFGSTYTGTTALLGDSAVEWHHFAESWRKSDGSRSFYIDGVLRKHDYFAAGSAVLRNTYLILGVSCNTFLLDDDYTHCASGRKRCYDRPDRPFDPKPASHSRPAGRTLLSALSLASALSLSPLLSLSLVASAALSLASAALSLASAALTCLCRSHLPLPLSPASAALACLYRSHGSTARSPVPRLAGPASVYTGEMDDLAIFSGALSQAAIAERWNASLSARLFEGLEPHLPIFYDFDGAHTMPHVPNLGHAGGEYNLTLGRVPKVRRCDLMMA
eukprot:84647-Prymnesium_polylepis.1